MSDEENVRCSVFGACGGCSHQDLSYQAQLQLKQSQVAELLKELPCQVEPIIPCAQPWRYRNKMEFAFGMDEAGKIILGLRRRGSFDDIVDIDDCWIQTEAANRIRKLSRNFFRQRNYPVYEHRSHGGVLRFLIVRQSYTQNKLMANLVVANAKALSGEDVRDWLQTLTSSVPELASVYISEQAEWSDTAFTENLRMVWGVPDLAESMESGEKKLQFKISPLAFFQTNTIQAQLLYQTIVDVSDLRGHETVLDLHCGTGTIGQLLAHRARWVYGIEVVAPAIADAKVNADVNGIRNVTYIVDKAETWLKWNGDEVDADVWVLDPPRSGLHPKILGKRMTELEQKPDKIIYVSCNPKHLPVDLAKILPWYRIERVVPVDMFPHTPHLEVVTSLRLI